MDFVHQHLAPGCTEEDLRQLAAWPLQRGHGQYGPPLLSAQWRASSGAEKGGAQNLTSGPS